VLARQDGVKELPTRGHADGASIFALSPWQRWLSAVSTATTTSDGMPARACPVLVELLGPELAPGYGAVAKTGATPSITCARWLPAHGEKIEGAGRRGLRRRPVELDDIGEGRPPPSLEKSGELPYPTVIRSGNLLKKGDGHGLQT